jgi:hypothetical protein
MRAPVTTRDRQLMAQISEHHALMKFYPNAVMQCVILPSYRLFKANVSFHLSQMATEQQQQPLSPLTPARQPQSFGSALTTSALIPESPGATSPFKGSTTSESPRLDVPSQSPAEKLEAVKQYLRDRSDQPLHHVEYVGLVSLLKDSVQGLALFSFQFRSV